MAIPCAIILNGNLSTMPTNFCTPFLFNQKKLKTPSYAMYPLQLDVEEE